MSMSQQLYQCVIDGFCYQSRETMMVHMKMQHNVTRFDSILVRKRPLEGID